MESTLLFLDLMEGGWLSFIQMQAGLVIGLMISVIPRAMDVIDKAADEVPAWIGGENNRAAKRKTSARYKPWWRATSANWKTA